MFLKSSIANVAKTTLFATILVDSFVALPKAPQTGTSKIDVSRFQIRDTFICQSFDLLYF